MFAPTHRDGGLVQFNRAGGRNLAGPALNRENSIFTDVDGTLIQRGQPNEKLIEFLKVKKSEGCKLVLWSARGEAYAKRAAEQCGIAELFDSICGKPTHIIDDKGFQWAKNVRAIVDFEL